MSMSLSLVQSCRHSLRLEQKLKYGSCLPMLEVALKSSQAQRAVKQLADYKEAGNYRSLIDWILCSCLPQYQEPCLAFYRDECPPLRETEDKTKIDAIDDLLCRMLTEAIRLEKAQEAITWRRLMGYAL